MCEQSPVALCPKPPSSSSASGGCASPKCAKVPKVLRILPMKFPKDRSDFLLINLPVLYFFSFRFVVLGFMGCFLTLFSFRVSMALFRIRTERKWNGLWSRTCLPGCLPLLLLLFSLHKPYRWGGTDSVPVRHMITDIIPLTSRQYVIVTRPRVLMGEALSPETTEMSCYSLSTSQVQLLPHRWLSALAVFHTLSPPLFLPPSLPPLCSYNAQVPIWRILSKACPSDINLINLD